MAVADNIYISTGADMVSVANKIRDKAGVSNGLIFPDGWIEAIEGIKTGSGGTMPSRQFKIIKATLYVRGRSTGEYTYSGTYKLSIDSSALSMSLSTSYQTSSSTGVATSLINNTYTSSNFPSLSVTITTTGKKSSTKDDDFQIRVTQVYLELEYEEIVEDIYIKENGNWNKYSAVYKKENGIWVLQSNLKSIFDANTNYVRGN